MSEHEHFQELCALAASGQISTEEWQRLREHLEECLSCAEALSDFGRLGADLLTEYSENVPDGLQEQMRSRFLSRARETGAKLIGFPPAHAPSRVWTRSHAMLTGLLAASVLLAVGAFYFHSHSHSIFVSSTDVGGTVKTQNQIPSTVAIQSEEPDVDPLLRKIRSLEEERQTLETKLSAVATQQSELERRSKELVGELEANNLQLNSSQAERANATWQLAATREALEKADSRLAAKETQLNLAKSDKEKLVEELAFERANAEQVRALLATSKDGQSILAARNLHIVDVYDADTHGQRRAFGRIFYVENQELIFYAYDLTDPRHANAEFYAWGASLGHGEEVARLGILHNDGQSEKRWVLKYNDARVLVKLDSIFVTSETGSDPQKPKGKRVLFAVLAGQPNHP